MARLDGSTPDLIISDFRLQDGATGIEAIARLRNAFGAAIPAFLISGDISPERLREAQEQRPSSAAQAGQPMACAP